MPLANKYYDRHFDCNAVKILPGEYYGTKDGTLIVTVLGSCISVCLFDPLTKTGGMNHFLLPNEESGGTSPVSESARYGVYAMEMLINQLLKIGASRKRLQAKVFGGGNVLKGLITNNVGERNAEFTFDYLRTESIPVIAKDVLDEFPRKVYFFPETGKVLVRKIKSLHNSTIVDRESEYRMRIRQTAKQTGDVDLF